MTGRPQGPGMTGGRCQPGEISSLPAVYKHYFYLAAPQQPTPFQQLSTHTSTLKASFKIKGTRRLKQNNKMELVCKHLTHRSSGHTVSDLSCCGRESLPPVVRKDHQSSSCFKQISRVQLSAHRLKRRSY